MSTPGWYPDPAGAPNRFRYWDGQAWSPETTDQPGAAPLGSGGGGGQRPGRQQGRGRDGRRLGPVILVIAFAVALVVAGVLVFRGLFATRPIVDPGPLPSSTVSGWDDSSPTAEPETPTPTPSAPSPSPSPTPTPSPEPSSDEPVQPCPQGRPTVRQDHPSDGRVHGGGLSFPRVSGWDSTSGSGFSWAYDVGAQRKLLEPEWQASLAVGALFTGDGFDEPRRAAELVMQCMITSGFYDQTAERENVWSKAVTVDGRPGWSIRSEVRIDDPQIEAEGDTVDVIVVDTGSPESLAMFVGAVSIGDSGLLTTLNSTIDTLRVE